MRLSIFTDELGVDLTQGISVLKDWGLTWLDLRGRVFGKHFEGLDPDELPRLKKLVNDQGFRVGCLESSLAKVHLPDEERLEQEKQKLESIIRAADALDCRLVRAFFFWQPQPKQQGAVAVQPDQLQKVVDLFAPLYERAKAAGLTLAFENCGVTVDEVFAMLDALGDNDCGLAWDCANEYLAGIEPDAAAMAERVKRSLCVHVKARGIVPGLAEHEVPWSKILFELAASGFEGPVSIETHNPDKSVSATDMSRKVLDGLNKAWPGGMAAAVPKGCFDFEPVRFVVVGLGMGRARSKHIQETEGTELAGVVDIDEERAKAVSNELGVEYTTDLSPWLERKDVEAVMVVTPTGRHAEVGVRALESGRHVLTTKPMDANLDACDRLIQTADKVGKLLAVDFAMRLRPDVQRLKQRFEAGDFGRFSGGTVSLKVLRKMAYFQANGGWRGTRALDGGGVMSNQNIHHIDELVYCLGMPVRVAMAAWTQMREIEAEDLACARWVYEDGAVIQLYATTTYPHGTWKHELELHGDRGAVWRMRGGPVATPLERWFVGEAWQDAPPPPTIPPWANSMQNLADAIRTGAELVCDGRDGRRSRQVLDAMYESAARQGAWVHVAGFSGP